MIAVLAGLGAFVWRVQRKRAPASRRPAPQIPSKRPPPVDDANGADQRPSFSNEAIESMHDEVFKLAFGVARFDYQIMGDHAVVLERVDDAVSGSVHQRENFPRRPMLLPKLMQALNDAESTQSSLVRLIIEDPALAGSVLKGANSAFYRRSPEPIESLDRAVVVLGTEGLRSLMATAILQPVFRLPPGYFDKFAALTWEQARREATAAEFYAKSTGSCDPFVAQLLGLLSALARIVIFRLTMDRYRERPNILPRAEVFIRSIQQHAAPVARLIASTWELSGVSLVALDEQANKIVPEKMSSLGQAVYYGELCGALALLHSRAVWSRDGAHAILLAQGLPPRILEGLWDAAIEAGEDF